MSNDNLISQTDIKKTGFIGVCAISIACMIGSGWLFSSAKVAGAVGPLAFIVWGVGAIITLFSILFVAEIVSIFPKRGIVTRISTLSHNRYFGFVFAFSNWFGIVAVIPTEAAATVQYLSYISPTFQEIIFNTKEGHMTFYGVIFAYGIMCVYLLMNYWGMALLTKLNNGITLLKMVIPVGVAFILIYSGWNFANLSDIPESVSSFAGATNGIIGAVILGGVVYAFNGFQAAASFAEEVKNPRKTIPLAMITSVLIVLVIYMILQLSFLVSVDPAELQQKGWQSLSATFSSPFVQLALTFGLNIVVLILYVDAAIAPSGTGAVYLGSTARLSTAMSKANQLPKFLDKVHPKYNFSRRSLIFNFALCCIILLFNDSWEALMIQVSLMHVIGYIAMPIALGGLAHQKLRGKTFKIPFLDVLAPIYIFIMFVLMIYIGFSDITLTLSTCSVLLLFFGISELKNNHKKTSQGLLTAISVLIMFWVVDIFAYFHASCEGWIYYILLMMFSFLSYFVLTNKSFVTKCLLFQHDDNKKYIQKHAHN